MSIQKKSITGLIAIASIIGAVCAEADTYPNRPITLIVPYAAGGATDIAARVYAEKLSQMWGQPVVVDNRPGASGNIGTAILATAKPDGHTIGLVSSQHASAPALYSNLPYKLNDFKAVIIPTKINMGLMASSNFKFNNIQEVVEFAKKNPGELTAATAGTTSSQNLWLKEFQSAAGVEFLEVPFKSASPAYVDVIAGRVDIFFDSPNPVIDQVKTGQLKILATGGKERSNLFPQVPTLLEEGYEVGAEMISWNAVLVPQKTPDDIIIKLNTAFSEILKDPSVIKKFGEINTQIHGGTSQEAEQWIQAEAIRQAKVIADHNITTN